MFIVKHADGASARPYEKWPIINSATVFKGGVVKVVATGVDGADDVADTIYGICKGFVTPNNVSLDNALATQYDGTYTAGTSYAAASDNVTDKKIQALVEPILPGDIIRAEADATLGTTTGSNLVGYFIDVLTTDERKLDESNTHAANQLQFLIVGQPGKGNYVDVKLVENQMNGNVAA